MEYLVVAFRSRANVFAFYEFLKQNRIECEIINTPKEANVGCGLSVKTPTFQYANVKMTINRLNLKNFAGVFLVKIVGGRKFVKTV